MILIVSSFTSTSCLNTPSSIYFSYIFLYVTWISSKFGSPSSSLHLELVLLNSTCWDNPLLLSAVTIVFSCVDEIATWLATKHLSEVQIVSFLRERRVTTVLIWSSSVSWHIERLPYLFECNGTFDLSMTISTIFFALNPPNFPVFNRRGWVSNSIFLKDRISSSSSGHEIDPPSCMWPIPAIEIPDRCLFKQKPTLDASC